MKKMFLKIGKFFLMHKILIVFGMIIIGGGIFYLLKNNSSENHLANSSKPFAVQKGDLSVTVSGTGQIYAESQVDLKGVVAGDGIEVTEVTIKDDQKVSKGDLIAVLDTTEPMKKVRDAELNLEIALLSQKQTERQNDNQTIEDKWTRQLQEISVQQKKNSLKDATDNLEDYYIRAPFDGIVTDLSVEAGDSISQSDVIASVITKKMYAQISLNEVDAVKVEEGDEVKLTFDALPEISAKGTVSKIDTIGENSQNVISYDAEIVFESIEKLKPGMSVNAEIIVESKKDVLYVSNSVIKMDKEGNNYVFMINRGTNIKEKNEENLQTNFIKKEVKTGIKTDVYTEITEGLQEGDSIILATENNENYFDTETNQKGGTFMFGGMGSGGRRPPQ